MTLLRECNQYSRRSLSMCCLCDACRDVYSWEM